MGSSIEVWTRTAIIGLTLHLLPVLLLLLTLAPPVVECGGSHWVVRMPSLRWCEAHDRQQGCGLGCLASSKAKQAREKQSALRFLHPALYLSWCTDEGIHYSTASLHVSSSFSMEASKCSSLNLLITAEASPTVPHPLCQLLWLLFACQGHWRLASLCWSPLDGLLTTHCPHMHELNLIVILLRASHWR